MRLSAMLALQTLIFGAFFKIFVADGVYENFEQAQADLKSIKEFISKGMEAMMQERKGDEQGDGADGKTCCSPRGCAPCALRGVPMQFYPVPAPPPLPYVVPMRTVFEPVEHDHPPLHTLREMLKMVPSEKRWVQASSCSTSSSESDTSSSSSSDTSSDIDYYDGFPIHVKGL